MNFLFREIWEPFFYILFILSNCLYNIANIYISCLFAVWCAFPLKNFDPSIICSSIINIRAMNLHCMQCLLSLIVFFINLHGTLSSYISDKSELKFLFLNWILLQIIILIVDYFKIKIKCLFSELTIELQQILVENRNDPNFFFQEISPAGLNELVLFEVRNKPNRVRVHYNPQTSTISLLLIELRSKPTPVYVQRNISLPLSFTNAPNNCLFFSNSWNCRLIDILSF